MGSAGGRRRGIERTMRKVGNEATGGKVCVCALFVTNL